MERLETERLVRRALAEDLLVVEYQPIVEVTTGKIVQAEALLRIDDADGGRFSPEHFLLIAGEIGLMPAMDERVRTLALSQLAQWRTNSSLNGIERLALNLTARELENPNFASQMARSIHAAGLHGSDLSVEVTEHALMQTSHAALTSLADLRESGIHVGLDDFGMGFSSLSCLHSFTLDFLKIDKSFVERIATDRRSAKVIRAMIDLAHALGLSVVAEGVESLDQFARLQDLGCDRAQGFYFSAPVSPDDFAKLPPSAKGGTNTRPLPKPS